MTLFWQGPYPPEVQPDTRGRWKRSCPTSRLRRGGHSADWRRILPLCNAASQRSQSPSQSPPLQPPPRRAAAAPPAAAVAAARRRWGLRRRASAARRRGLRAKLAAPQEHHLGRMSIFSTCSASMQRPSCEWRHAFLFVCLVHSMPSGLSAFWCRPHTVHRPQVLEGELDRAKQAFGKAADYFGEESAAAPEQGGVEPARFFSALLLFVQASSHKP